MKNQRFFTRNFVPTAQSLQTLMKGMVIYMIQNKLRYLVLLASIGVLSILYNRYVMGIIFLTILIMPFFLFALLSFSYGMVTAELVSIVHVANKGEMIPISVQLNNPTIFPISNLTIYLKYKNAYSPKQYKKEFSVSLDRRTNTTVLCNILSEFSGNLEISLTGIRLYDYMKIFSLKNKLKGEAKIAVLPYFHEIMENNFLKRNSQIVESDYYSSVKSGDDPSEVFIIREYKEGDRPQRIHWKLSIKQDQLMIKDFSDPLNCSVLIFVNLKVPPEGDVMSYMDALLESSLSISYSFLSVGQIHYLSWFEEKHGVCRRIRIMKEKDLFEAVDGLLQTIPHSEKTDGLAAYLAEHPNDQYSDFLYVTGEIPSSRINSISMIRTNTKQIIYVRDFNNIYGTNETQEYREQELIEEYTRSSAELGIGLLPVRIGNIKADIEQLKLN